jgi:hypothetical protein
MKVSSKEKPKLAYANLELERSEFCKGSSDCKNSSVKKGNEDLGYISASL